MVESRGENYYYFSLVFTLRFVCVCFERKQDANDISIHRINVIPFYTTMCQVACECAMLHFALSPVPSIGVSASLTASNT